MKLLVDETDLFYLRCAAIDLLLRNDIPKHLMRFEIDNALQNTKLRDLKNDANRSKCAD